MEILAESISTLIVAAAIGSGLIAGVFFAFSTFVMLGLKRLPPYEGIAAMQSINIAVINPLFMTVFLGTALLCSIIIVAAVTHWTHASLNLLIGGLTYLVGSFFVTINCNVPLNNSLAKLLPGDSTAVEFWSSYVKQWTRWNHVRMFATLIALISFLLDPLVSNR